MQPEKEGRVREAIILVGDILCSITRSIGDPAEARIQEKSAQHEEHEGKRARLMSRAGREIVGPGYSKEPIRGELKQQAPCTQYPSAWGGGQEVIIIWVEVVCRGGVCRSMIKEVVRTCWLMHWTRGETRECLNLVGALLDSPRRNKGDCRSCDKRSWSWRRKKRRTTHGLIRQDHR
jgi:hypothetical protein